MTDNRTTRSVRDIIELLGRSGFASYVLRGNDKRKVVIVTPSLVGRVLATGFDGIEGETDSYISEKQIHKGLTPSRPGGDWASVGGEDRIWLAPENGRYGFFMPREAMQTFENYLVPEPLNSTPFEVSEVADDKKSISSTASISLQNYVGTNFQIELRRHVRILEHCPYCTGFEGEIEVVGFETDNWISNIGSKCWDKATGCVSVWTIGQFRGYPQSVVIMPLQSDSNSELGEPVTTGYDKLLSPSGGPPPPDYLVIKRNHVLLKANGSVQTKVEIASGRALGRLAGIDLASCQLNIVDFELYPRMNYAASFPLPYGGDPYAGGALSTFVLSKESGEVPFYELECCSPALFLAPNERFCHRTRTFRIRGEVSPIAAICKQHFFAEYEELRRFDDNAP